jgi:hypothetical protein
MSHPSQKGTDFTYNLCPGRRVHCGHRPLNGNLDESAHREALASVPLANRKDDASTPSAMHGFYL